MKIVVLDGYTENPGDLSWDCIENLVELTVYPRTAPDQIIERGKDADILIVNKVAITRELLEHLPNLKFVATLALTGNFWTMSNVDERIFKKLGTHLTCSPQQ